MEFSEIKKIGKTAWSKIKGECIFCKIIEQKDGEIVFENDDVIAFAPLERDVVAEGHLLVVPKNHYENIFDIPAKELSKVSKTAKEISEILKEKETLDAVNIMHASGKEAQQSVNHFHLHLIPRTDDGLDLWPETEYEEENYSENYGKIREILEEK